MHGTRTDLVQFTLPKVTPLPGHNIDMPYVLVGDAFPLTTTLMKPFP